MPPKIKRKPVVPTDASMESLHQDIDLLSELIRDKDQAEEAVKSQRVIVFEQMTKLGVTTTTSQNGKSRVTATMVVPVSRTVNEDKLKRKVGPSIWKRITTLVLDKKKLDALVSDGTIDAVDLADCVDETPGTAYVKTTTK